MNSAAKELLAAHPRLARIAKREGKAPGDGFASAWDFYLGCEGAHGLDDRRLGQLLRHARSLHGEDKGQRADYVQRTIIAVRAEVPRLDGPAETDEQREALGLAIGRRWALGDGDPIVGGRIGGRGGSAVVWLRRRSGGVLRIPRLANLFDPKAHVREVSIAAGTNVMPLNGEEAIRVAQHVIALCELDLVDEPDEARECVREFIELLGKIIDAKLEGTPKQRWESLVKRETEQEELASHVIAARTVAMRDERARLWLPAGPFRASIGGGAKAPDWPHLVARMAEIGWERKEIDTWEPGTAHDERVASKRMKIVCFVAPEDWT
jgi:hypothetical protein